MFSHLDVTLTKFPDSPDAIFPYEIRDHCYFSRSEDEKKQKIRNQLSEVKFLEGDAVKTKRGICDELLVDENKVIACSCNYNYCNVEPKNVGPNVGPNAGPNVGPNVGPKEGPNVANTTTTNTTGILFIILFSMFCQKLLMK